jgi:hypothetical protein
MWLELKLLRTPGIDSRKSITCENQFRRGDGGGGGREDVRPKLIPAIKNLWDMADSIRYLVPTQFQESIFPPITRPISALFSVIW